MELPSEMVSAVALMDLHHPGWAARVDLSTLDIADSMFCVLGQVVQTGPGRWVEKMHRLGLRSTPNASGDWLDEPVAYCFSARDYQPFWAHVISTRQQEALTNA